jgi:hypothetical protein
LRGLQQNLTVPYLNEEMDDKTGLIFHNIRGAAAEKE